VSTAENETPPLRVGLLGTSARARDRFAALFAGAGKGDCVLVDLPAAEVLVVDLDGAAGTWPAHRARAPGVPALLIAGASTAVPEGETVLRKPVAPRIVLQRLLALRAGGLPPAASGEGPPPREATVILAPTLRGEPLTERAEAGQDLLPGADPGLLAELCGEAEDVDLDDPEVVKRLMLPVENRLLGAVQRAAREAEAQGGARVVVAGPLAVTVPPDGGGVRATASVSALRALCRGVLPRVEVGPPGEPSGDAPRPGPLSASDASWRSTEACLWQLALWTYRGLLPSGTAIRGRVYLSRWPNFTRLAETPHALRIAALWADQPATLPDTARALAVPQRFVFAFYGAAHATGLAGQARRRSDYLFETQAPEAREDRRLLVGAVSRLRGMMRR
jgi:hypothetical protein